jgi:hypothetical protein
MFAFIAGINDTRGKLFTDLNDTGDKLLPVSLTPCSDYYVLSLILIDSMTPAMINRR